jgi:hypothetical protein
MGLLNKLMFWKKEPSLDFNSGIDTSFAPAPSPTGLPSANSGFASPRFGEPTLDNSTFGAPQADFGMSQPAFVPRPNYGMEQPKILSETSPGFSPGIQRDTYDKNLEIVSMKLDNLKAALENINQRLVNIERIAMDSMREDQQRRRGTW